MKLGILEVDGEVHRFEEDRVLRVRLVEPPELRKPRGSLPLF